MSFLDQLIFVAPAILIAITIHEFSHGYVAHLLGDPTPEQQGRLTLNPIPHLDPLGTLMLIFAHFGWAKPVQVNPFYFKGDRQRGMLFVALAGPVSNLLLAFIGAILYNLFGAYGGFFSSFIFIFIIINVNLLLFNLIPVPPLDGSKILVGLLPRRMHGTIYQIEAYGPIILMLLIITDVTSKILGPITMGIIGVLLQISHVLVG